jgi:hypothetical protein
MIYLLVIIFLLLSGLTILDLVKTKYKNLIFILIGVVLFIVAGFRPAYADRDYDNYIDFFDQNLTFGDSIVEPSFILISIIIHKFLFAKPIFVFIIYAFIAICLKLLAIKQLSKFQFISLLLYFSYLFILQDMTQIRAGVATAFLLLCIKPLYERNLWRFFLFGSLAILFHYSAIIVLPLWFFNSQKINRWAYGLSIIFSYFLFFSSSVYITQMSNYLPSGYILSKFLEYQFADNAIINVFNTWQLMRCILSFIFLWKIDVIVKHNRYGILLVKIYILATCLYVILAANPPIASRVTDLFAGVDIILIPCLLFLFKPRWAPLILVITIGFSYLSLILFYTKIIS